MLDLHNVPSGWGLSPRLFGLSSYGLFVMLGLICGVGYYFWYMRGKRPGGERTAIIVLGMLLGASIGAKLPVLVQGLSQPERLWGLILSGRSVLGGLLGGFLGVLLAKRLFHIEGRYGNLIAPAAALGIGIGRFGCLLAGCCYGRAASWGIDFGDGLLRLPTQIFEIVFHLGAFLVLHLLRGRVKKPGVLFSGYVCAYLVFRYLTEFLRAETPIFAGQTYYQLLCLGGLLLMGLRGLYRARRADVERSE